MLYNNYILYHRLEMSNKAYGIYKNNNSSAIYSFGLSDKKIIIENIRFL